MCCLCVGVLAFTYSVGLPTLYVRACLLSSLAITWMKINVHVYTHAHDHIYAHIHRSFKDSAILSIAHRLSTIMDYDRILVLIN